MDNATTTRLGFQDATLTRQKRNAHDNACNDLCDSAPRKKGTDDGSENGRCSC
jgi:hypothetical protein